MKFDTNTLDIAVTNPRLNEIDSNRKSQLIREDYRD